MIKGYFIRLLSLILSISMILVLFTVCADNSTNNDDPENPANSETPENPEVPTRVLLISIDGLRADAIENTEYGRELLENSAYSLAVTTVYPSITLPCHMSMFHSVTPDKHGVSTNTYTPSDTLGAGICEALSAVGKSSAIFYNWREIGDIVTEGAANTSCYIPGETDGWEETNKQLGDAAIEYIKTSPTDFLFLYLGFLDETGHRYGWLSEEYYYALNESFSLIDKVITEAKKQNYTVMITSDHGGHGTGHGSDAAEDMTIPLFIIGEGFEKGRNLGARSILDVAPTVLDLLRVKAPEYWQGKSVK